MIREPGSFDPIRPDEIDTFAFDFGAEIEDDEIISTTWTCEVSQSSDNPDPNPQSHISDVGFTNITFDAVTGEQLSQALSYATISGMVDSVMYHLTATIVTDTGRRLVDAADLLCVLGEDQPIPVVPAGGVAFDIDAWLMRYPEFEGIAADKATWLWTEASLYLRNDGSSPVDDLPTRSVLLGMLTAHLAVLFGGKGPASGMVGRINSKSINGISVSSDGFNVSGTSAWYLTTRYGADYWKATAAYRTMHYFPGPQRNFNTIWPYIPRP